MKAHRLKNKKSKLFRLLMQFEMEFRLLLTGTPIQNNLDELWTLLHFIEPKIFHSLEDFSEKYGTLDGVEKVSIFNNLLSNAFIILYVFSLL